MTWTINGTDPRTLGLIVADISGWLDQPAESYAVGTIPGRPGQLLLSNTPDVAAVRLVARGIVEGTDIATARANLDKLKALFAVVTGATLAVVFTDQAGRERRARCTRFALPVPAAQMIARKIPVELELVSYDPYAQDTGDTTVGGLGAGGSPCPQGTAPSRPVVTITGAATNPVVTLKRSDGTTAATLSLTITTIAGDSLVIDCEKQTIRLNGVNRLDALSGGDFLLFDVVAQGGFATSAWPQLAVSGLGTGSAAVSYRKRWR